MIVARMQVTPSFGGRLPKQIQRILPICILFFFVTLFYSKFDTLGSHIQITNDVFRRLMTTQAPRQVNGDFFPKKIWQLWKVDPLEFEERELTRARTWNVKNPGYRYEALTDSNGLHYVETYFGPNGLDRPDIVYIYRTLTAKIIQADLLRYLVMYVEGGTYADIDVEALQPIDNFIPGNFSQKDVELVVSVEIDEPNFNQHPILGPKSQSFCQWTFMSKPRSTVMLRLINNIIEWLQDVSRAQAVPISDIVLNFDEVLTGTGPSAFTSAVLADMKEKTGHEVQWEQFHGIQSPVLVGDTLVLTVFAFAAGQGHSNSANHDHPNALVKHHYHASLWPDKHPRYSPPAYGMVEECNWKPDCIAEWDANTAAFENLGEEQKNALIADKKVADAVRFDEETAGQARVDKEWQDGSDAELREQCAKLPPAPVVEPASIFGGLPQPQPEAQAAIIPEGGAQPNAETLPAAPAAPEAQTGGQTAPQAKAADPAAPQPQPELPIAPAVVSPAPQAKPEVVAGPPKPVPEAPVPHPAAVEPPAAHVQKIPDPRAQPELRKAAVETPSQHTAREWGME